MAQYYHSSYYDKKPSLFQNKRVLFVVIGVALLAVVGGIWMMIASSNAGPKNDLTRLAGRYAALNTFAITSQKKVKNADLRVINGNAVLLIGSDSKTISDLLAEQFGTKKLPDDVRKSEAYGADVTEAMKSAELLDKFDNKYIDILIEKIELTLPLLKQTHSKTGNRQLKDSLDKSYRNLQEIKKQVTEFDKQNI